MGDALYRGMDRAEIDRQYNARGTVPDIQPFLDDYARLSAEARRDLDVVRDVSFGDRPEEVMDIFPAGPKAPVFVFLHGGYWRLLSKDESSFMAKPMVGAGIAVASVNYALAPHVTLDEIVRETRAAISHLWRNADAYGIDRDRIFVGGSSAGGHLTGMALASGWHGDFDVPETIVAGGVSASGLFDLEPIASSHINEWISLDTAAARRNSPLFQIGPHGGPLIVTWGGSETDEFKRQSRDYAGAWRAAGHACAEFEVSDRNHFDIVLDLANTERDLCKRTIRMIETGMV